MDVSVIVPTYQSASTIEQCLTSLLSQKGAKKYEIIVIDDGSTDRTHSIAKKYPVRFFYQSHRGPAAARNRGAKLAMARILLFTDSDCVAAPGWLSEMTRPFWQKAVVGVQGCYKTKQRSLTAKFAQLEIEDRYDSFQRLGSIDFLSTYSAAYRKDVFFSHGGFDESFGSANSEDSDLSFRVAKTGGKMVFSRKAFVYHEHPDSVAKYFIQKFWRAYWRIKLYSKHKDKAISESYTPQSLKIQIAIFYPMLLCALGYLFAQLPLEYGIYFLGLMLISSIRLVAKNLHKNVAVGILTPAYVLLRTAAFSLGLLVGVLLWKRK